MGYGYMLKHRQTSISNESFPIKDYDSYMSYYYNSCHVTLNLQRLPRNTHNFHLKSRVIFGTIHLFFKIGGCITLKQTH